MVQTEPAIPLPKFREIARSLALTFDDLRADAVFTIPVFEARSLSLQTAAPSGLRIRLRRELNRP